MPNPVMVMDYANMFCGSAPQNDKDSNHLVLTEVQLPSMDIQYVDHRPGGAPVGIEIDVIMARFEVKFTLIGIVRQVWEILLRLDPHANNFFIYGNVRDQLTGQALQAEAQIYGQLASVEPQPFRRGDLMNTKFSIRGIQRYKFNLAGTPIYDWDFFSNVWAVGGQDQSGNMR